MDTVDKRNGNSVTDSLKSFLKTINNDNSMLFLSLCCVVFTASLHYLFLLIFPSLDYEDPGFGLVIFYSSIGLFLVLFLMLAPAIVAHFILSETKKDEKDFILSMFYDKKGVLVFLGYYLPNFIFIELILFELYMEVSGYNFAKITFLIFYILTVTFFSLIISTLNQKESPVALKKDNIKKILYDTPKCFVFKEITFLFRAAAKSSAEDARSRHNFRIVGLILRDFGVILLSS